jgi:hypothetical protein
VSLPLPLTVPALVVPALMCAIASCRQVISKTGGMVMTPLRQRMLEDMQLSGLAPNTQQAYIRAVRQLAVGPPYQSPTILEASQ